MQHEESYQFLVQQRNRIHKEGGLEITITVERMPAAKYLRDVGLQGGSAFIWPGVPVNPQPTVPTLEKTFTARPGQTLSAAGRALMDLVTRLVSDFERAHPAL